MVRIVLILILVLLNAIFGIPDHFTTSSPYWLRALSYSFFHAGWLHLSVNCLAIWTIYRYPCKPCRDLLFPFIIAVLVYPLSFRPVIGFSNVLYAVLGLRTPSLKSSWWKQTPVIIFLIITFALIFIPRFSATTHIAAFILGMAGAAISRFFKDISSDYRRYI